MQTYVEGARGCGYRKPGGLYLVSGELSEKCDRLPFEVSVCPTCGEGIKPARGWTWVDGEKLIPPVVHGSDHHNLVCPLSPVEGTEGDDVPQSRLGRCGLLWIGVQHYPTAQDFMQEARRMGVSRRIHNVPRDFGVGETWVLLGHAKTITKQCEQCDFDDPDEECPICEGRGFFYAPGIVTAFRPTAIEYVVKGDETEEELEQMVKRGLTPVKVVKADEQTEMGVE